MSNLEKCLFFAFIFFAICYIIRIFVAFRIKTSWYEYVCRLHVQAITRLNEKGNINSWDGEKYDSDYYLLPSSGSLLINPKHWLKFKIEQFEEYEAFNSKMHSLIAKGKK